MKFAIVAIFALALTMGVQASVIPWGGPSLAVSPWGLGHGGVLSSGVLAGGVLGGVGPVWSGAGSAWGAPAGVWGGNGLVLGGNGLVLGGHGPAAVTVAASPSHVVGHGAAVLVGPAHEGTYIAKTRGAIHKAPLAGHIQSVASINAAPAPGTW